MIVAAWICLVAPLAAALLITLLGTGLLRLHGAVRVLDAAARPGWELRDSARRLGPRGAQLLPADRLLARPARGGRGRQEGLHHERDRRRNDGAGVLPADPAPQHA